MKRRRDLFISQYNALFEKKIEAPPAAIYVFVETDYSAVSVKGRLMRQTLGLYPVMHLE